MSVRGIRGAITAAEDKPEIVIAAAQNLLQAILSANSGLSPDDLASVLFTVTPDLSSTYPATAARQLGWTAVPLMCAQEIDVPGGLPRTIRVLLHWNTNCSQGEIVHVYLGDAAVLRPDLSRKAG